MRADDSNHSISDYQTPPASIVQQANDSELRAAFLSSPRFRRSHSEGRSGGTPHPAFPNAVIVQNPCYTVLSMRIRNLYSRTLDAYHRIICDECLHARVE